MNPSVIGLILIPVCVFILTAVFAAVRGAIRFAQYLTHAEETQAAIAKSNQEISDRLGKYMERTDGVVHDLDRRLYSLERTI